MSEGSTPSGGTRRKETSGGLCRRTLQYSHMDGVAHAARADGHAQRAFWAILFLISLAICLYLVGVSISRYMSYPVHTSVERVEVSQLPFPAVTICNQNPIVASRLPRLAQIYDVDWDLFIDYLDDGDSGQGRVAFNLTEFGLDHNKGAKLKLMSLYSHLPHDEMLEGGHQLEKMLIKCSFDQRECSSQQFRRFLSPMYGNCYTFNSGTDDEGIRFIPNVGPNHGLELELFIEQGEYVNPVSEVAGVRVLIANQSYTPFVNVEGFTASTGSATYISMTRAEKQLLGPPYERCVDEHHDEALKFGFRSTNQHAGYTALACRSACYQYHVNQTCECGDYEHSRVVSNKERFHYITPCTTRNQLRCMYGVRQSHGDGKLDCHQQCPPLCSEVRYKTDRSLGQWPSSAKEVDVVERLLELSPLLARMYNEIDEAELISYIRENTLKIIIYFEDMEYERSTSKPSYLLVSLLSDVGGHVALWLGLSIISLFELVTLGWKLASRRCCRRQQDQSSPTHKYKHTAADSIV